MTTLRNPRRYLMSVCLVAALLPALGGCAGNAARPTAGDAPPPPADMAKYRTYSFVPGVIATSGRPLSRADETALREQIERALDERLAARGLQRVDQEADLFASYFVRGPTRATDIDAGDPAHGPGPWDEPGAVPPGAEWGRSTRGSEPGAFGIALTDTRTREPVWRARVEADVVSDGAGEIRRALDRAFRRYPASEETAQK